jgi:15-cis-phytoene synthase
VNPNSRPMDTFRSEQHEGTPVSPTVSTQIDLPALRSLMRGGSKSFFAASLLLPARVRAPATALYAYCRLADDAIDLGSDPHAAMRDLQERLDAIYAGRPRAIEADHALASVVHRFSLPRKLFDALLEGFLWDAEGRRHETLADVQAYGARVAGTVGAMMALIMGTRDHQAIARACELGVAMQLTNIARDVGEDARNGRLYLPRRWLAEAGIDADAWLKRPVFNAALGSVIARLLKAADTLYCRAEHGIKALPRDCRPAIRAARLVYAEIGSQLTREGLDSVNRRTVVSKQRKLALMARATGAALTSPGVAGTSLPVLPAVLFLVVATAQPPGAALAARQPARRTLEQRLVWMFDLFERQAEQRRAPGWPAHDDARA